MGDFYLTLPSSVKNPQFENTSSRYVTRLPEVLRLEQDKFVVAVTDIIYPYSFVNVGRPLNYWIHFKDRNPLRVQFPSAQYSDISHIVNTLNVESKPRRTKRSLTDSDADIVSAKRFKRQQSVIDKHRRLQQQKEAYEKEQNAVKDGATDGKTYDAVKDGATDGKTVGAVKGGEEDGTINDAVNEKAKAGQAFLDKFKNLKKGEETHKKKLEEESKKLEAESKKLEAESKKLEAETEKVEEATEKFKEASQKKLDDYKKVMKGKKEVEKTGQEKLDAYAKVLKGKEEHEKAEREKNQKAIDNVKKIVAEAEKFDKETELKKQQEEAKQQAEAKKQEEAKKHEEAKKEAEKEATQPINPIISPAAQISEKQAILDKHANVLKGAAQHAEQQKAAGQAVLDKHTNILKEAGQAELDKHAAVLKGAAQHVEQQKAAGQAVLDKHVAIMKTAGQSTLNTNVSKEAANKKAETAEQANKILQKHKLLNEAKLEHEKASLEYPHAALNVYNKNSDRNLYAEDKQKMEKIRSRLAIEELKTPQEYLYFVERDGRVHVEFLDSSVLFVEFEPSCAYFLGFHDTIIRETSVAQSKVDTFGNVSTIYLYCDIVDPIIVGDQKNQLLSVIPCRGKYGEMIHHTIPYPRYLPIMNSNIDSIKVELLSEFAEPINFNWGSTIIVLHFKKLT